MNRWMLVIIWHYPEPAWNIALLWNRGFQILAWSGQCQRKRVRIPREPKLHYCTSSTSKMNRCKSMKGFQVSNWFLTWGLRDGDVHGPAPSLPTVYPQQWVPAYLDCRHCGIVRMHQKGMRIYSDFDSLRSSDPWGIEDLHHSPAVFLISFCAGTAVCGCKFAVQQVKAIYYIGL